MKAIRSLEQHVDSLMSYDFSHLTGEELLERLEDCRRSEYLEIAEAIRKGIAYDDIHEITKIDMWFIDKIAILVEMEHAMKERPAVLRIY